MSITPEEIKDHVGHEIVAVSYGSPAVNHCIECVDCGKVLMDDYGDVDDDDPTEGDFTPAEKKKYLSKAGNYCPQCGSDQLDAGRMETDGFTSWRDVECEGCGAEFQDVYGLTDVVKK